MEISTIEIMEHVRDVSISAEIRERLPDVLIPIYGDRVGKEEITRLLAERHQALENNVVSDHNLWDKRTRDRWAMHNPSVIIPVTLPANASAIDAYQFLPVSPFSMTGEMKRAAIVATGAPMWNLFNEDDPETLDDDAFRVFLQNLSHDILDPDQQEISTRFVDYVLTGKLPRRIFSHGTSVLQASGKFHPALIPYFIGARLGLTLQEVVHEHAIDILSERVTALRDPKVYAEWKRHTKLPIDKGRDHAFQDSLVALMYPEIKHVLEKMEITGKAAALVDEHSTAAGYIWDDVLKQEKIVSGNIKKMVAFRKRVAKNQNISDCDWNSFGESIVDIFGTVKIFEVLHLQGNHTVGSVRNRIPERAIFRSNRIRSLVEKEFSHEKERNIDEIAQELLSEDDSSEWSGINDY